MDIWMWAWVGWLAIALICLVIELITLELTFLMLGLGSLVGLVSSLTGLPIWAQVIIAAVAAALFLFLVRPSLLNRIHRSGQSARTNVDAIVGIGGEVTKQFVRLAGEVTLANGETWSARLSPVTRPRDLDVGERVVVTAIEGATAVVVPAER
ncbi:MULTISPECIES: NfeD family protein [unclassified Agrococcus]|uniref:NfeD family protein n=1 Tax=unclassified Agrococcus TaxID=2615065 RepID=UPI00360F446A